VSDVSHENVVFVLRVSVFAKPRHHPQGHALGQHVELGATRRRRRHEPQRINVVAFDIYAVERARVQMHVQIQARAKALDERQYALCEPGFFRGHLRRVMLRLIHRAA
jgi:hypothetical protein